MKMGWAGVDTWASTIGFACVLPHLVFVSVRDDHPLFKRLRTDDLDDSKDCAGIGGIADIRSIELTRNLKRPSYSLR